LFLGTILAATSIGITARVLADIERLDTPEGVTILGAAVVDDLLGIIALAIVGGIASASAAQAANHSVKLSESAMIACKAFGVWIVLTLAAVALTRPVDRLVGRVGGAAVVIALMVAFIGSAIAEFFGLAFIIGAYSVGLGLSRTKSAGRLLEQIQPIEHFLVPIFFATLGMLANFGAIFADWRIVVAGLAITLIAVVGKVLGCGFAAIPGGFNLRGAWRIGVGMTPRGEVALIVAGIGLSRSLIDQNLYGVSILMTLLTTIIAPVLLVRAFADGASGRRRPERRSRGLPSISQMPGLAIHIPPDLGQVLLDRLVQIAESAGWEVAYERDQRNIRLLRSRGDAAQVQLEGDRLTIDASDTRQQEFANFLNQARQSIAAAMQAK
jgi:Kef-type K+ transport system membrane component KefB